MREWSESERVDRVIIKEEAKKRRNRTNQKFLIEQANTPHIGQPEFGGHAPALRLPQPRSKVQGIAARILRLHHHLVVRRGRPPLAPQPRAVQRAAHAGNGVTEEWAGMGEGRKFDRRGKNERKRKKRAK